MMENRDETIEIWGRDFNGYCRTLNDFSEMEYGTEFKGVVNMESDYLRRSWINITNFFGGIETIEFRLPKFTTKDQYMNLIKFGHKFYQVLIDNKDYTDEYIGRQVLKCYLKHFNI